jgi:acylphosphatase
MAVPPVVSHSCRGFATIARLQIRAIPTNVTVEPQAKRFFVSGRVQGVGFRFFVEGKAAALGVSGYVKNLFDGRVEVYAIGNAVQLEALKSALQRGPRMAFVERMEEQEAEFLQEYGNAFTMERDD